MICTFDGNLTAIWMLISVRNIEKKNTFWYRDETTDINNVKEEKKARENFKYQSIFWHFESLEAE